MIYRKTELSENSRASFFVGFLMMKALPAAAVSAGWALSASLGTAMGEIMAAVIFVLGCSVMLVAHQTEDRLIITVVTIAAVIISILSRCNNVRNIISSADILITTVALAGRHLRQLNLILLLAAAELALLIIPELPRADMLLPLSAALTAGAAVSELAAIPDISGGYAVCGMTAALVLNLLA